MRTAFINALTELARNDERIVLVVADLGFGVVERFAQQFPERFFNVGIAEQNMTGIAAGLALCGKIVFTYSIANFPTLRCLEQIRNDICGHRANVTIVSVGGGFAYGPLGASHHATEDIALMRALPEMTVVAPGDPLETGEAVKALVHHSGPAYLRLGRDREPNIHGSPIRFALGKAIQVQAGSDATLISTGAMLHDSVRAADTLSYAGVHARVISMHTIKPLDEEAVLAAARETPVILTVEEHSIIGGLGTAVAELLAEHADFPVAFRRLGVPSSVTDWVGSQDFLKRRHSLSARAIADSAISLCRDGRRRERR